MYRKPRPHPTTDMSWLSGVRHAISKVCHRQRLPDIGPRTGKAAGKAGSKAGKQVVKQVPVGRPSDVTDSACETLALVLYRVLRIVERPDLYDAAGVA